MITGADMKKKVAKKKMAVGKKPVATGKKAVKKKTTKKKDRPRVVDGDFSTAQDGQCANRVFVAVGKTINLPGYEAIRVDYGCGRSVQDGQSFDKVREECLNDAVESIKEIINIVEGQLVK